MTLSPGARLGHYEIREPLGSGGMGEVFQALDRKLGRDVAIKVLPDELSRDGERIARFKREAQLLAALNHPNIAAIHGLEESEGTHYLVLELVPGETLAERVAKGPVPVGEALAVAMQISEALEEAHEKGIVHRDLKPGNVMLTEDGKVKVLDFGLARAFAEEKQQADSSLSPTLTRDATRSGVILGTAAYMSPEQARGRELDKRSDIFSFGAVLYEMLSGKKAFTGDDVSDILASVIKLEPNWSVLPKDLDSRIEKLLRRCLEKDRKRRRRDIGDVRIEIEEALASPESRAGTVERSRAPFLVAGVAGLLLGIAVTALVLPRSDERPVTRLSVSADELTLRSRHGLAIAPDGRTLAFARNGRLHLRRLGELETTELPSTDGARSLEFSPDGQWIVFDAYGLEKVPVSGGTPMNISPTQRQHGISWADDGIYYAERFVEGGRIMLISAEGGDPEVLVEPTESERLYYPRLLPGTRTLLLTTTKGGPSSFRVESHSLETGERRLLVEGGSDARYLPSGHLVYRVGSTLQAVRFDLDALEVVGVPTTVVDGVAPVLSSSDFGGAHYAVSDEGTLFYLSGDAGKDQVSFFDRLGESEPLAFPPALYGGARLSPDGTRIAVERDDDIWLYDIDRGAMSRLTFSSDNSRPLWTPDGNAILFASARGGVVQVFRKPADGSGEAETLTATEHDSRPDAISPDGSRLVYRVLVPESGTDLWTLELDGERNPRPYLQTEFNETAADVSPDGRWLAYVSDESGRREVYVRPFPEGGAKHVVSTNGGGSPLWSKNGRELFYREDNRLMAVPVTLGDELSVGTPEFLFQAAFSWVLVTNSFDVTADGEQFLVVEKSNQAPGELHVVLNWFEELERIAPAE